MTPQLAAPIISLCPQPPDSKSPPFARPLYYSTLSKRLARVAQRLVKEAVAVSHASLMKRTRGRPQSDAVLIIAAAKLVWVLSATERPVELPPGNPVRMEATMAHPQQDIEKLAARAQERELISRLTPDPTTRLRNELQAAEIRKRIKMLKQRLAKLSPAFEK